MLKPVGTTNYDYTVFSSLITISAFSAWEERFQDWVGSAIAFYIALLSRQALDEEVNVCDKYTQSLER